MAIYLFLINSVAVVRLAHLQYQPSHGTCLPSFIKISQFLLKLELSRTDGRTDSHPDFNSSLHPNHLYIYNPISNSISFR